jgi:hypothetical protein
MGVLKPHCRMQERMSEALTATAVASRDPDAVEELFRQKPVLHRYPGPALGGSIGDRPD